MRRDSDREGQGIPEIARAGKAANAEFEGRIVNGGAGDKPAPPSYSRTVPWSRDTLIRRFFPGKRLTTFRHHWLGYTSPQRIIELLHRLPGDTVDPRILRRMASHLQIKRPFGFLNVDQARRRTRGIPHPIEVRMAITYAKRAAKQERARRKQIMLLAAAAAPPKQPQSRRKASMGVPPWLKKERRNIRQRKWRAARKAQAIAQKAKRQCRGRVPVAGRLPAL